MSEEEANCVPSDTIRYVAEYWNVEVASAQVISDVLTENGWLQAFGRQSVRENTKVVLKAVLEVLSKS